MSTNDKGENFRGGKASIFISTISEEKLSKEYEHYSEPTARDVYLQALRKVYESVSLGSKDSLVRYAKLIACMNSMKSKETLRAYCEHDSIPLRVDAELITLACKHDQVEILECLVGKDSWILNCVSLDAGNDPLSSSYKDEQQHGCFYYAIRSGNVRLLDMLVNNYKPTGFQVDEGLDGLISRSYNELKLKNVPISTEMEFYVETKLVDLRFFSEDESVRVEDAGDPVGNIELQMEFLLESVRLLKEEYVDAVNEVDGKFLYVTKSIAENIHALKQQLKCTYDRIPWEEMEFCLICFILSMTTQKEVNLYFRYALNTKKILYHLDNFAKCLQDYKESDWKNIDAGKRFKLPQLQRENVVSGITDKYPPFSGLYSDYDVIRDAYTLEKVRKYVDIAVCVDHKKKEGELIITRTLQVLGEHLKNTLTSPKLSRGTIQVLSHLVPQETREIMTELRDSLLHCNILVFKRSDAEFHANIQKDLKKISVAVVYILYRNKIKIFRSLLKKIVESESLEIVKELAEVLKCVKYHPDHLKCENPHKNESLKTLFQKFSAALSEKTDYEKHLLLKIEEILNSGAGEKVWMDYILGFASVKSITDTVYDHRKIDKNWLYVMKYSANKVIQKLSSNWEREKLTEIMGLLTIVLDSAKPRIHPDRREELAKFAFEVFEVIYFEMDDIKWIEEFGTTLGKFRFRSSKKNSKQTSSDFPGSNESNLLRSKLNALQDILRSRGFGSSRKKNEFPTKKCVGSMEFALETLVLEILSIMGEGSDRLSNNQIFANDNVPLLMGKRLRNHLAHGNTLMDVLPFNLTWAIIGNAEKLASEDLLEDCRRIGKTAKFDHTRWRQGFEEDLAIIANQERMFAALEEGNFEELKSCLKLGADIKGRSWNSWTASHFAAKGPSLEIANFVMGDIRQLDDVVTEDTGQTPLHVAAAYGRKNLVRYYVKERRLNVNKVDDSGKTPLHVASLNGHLEVVSFLLKNNSITSKKDIGGYSAVHYAVQNGHIEVTKALFELETNVDLNQTIGGYTALYLAVEAGDTELVDYLLRNGANPNLSCDKGGVPLHSAALCGHLDIVKALLTHGADVNLKTFDGCTPLRDATERGHEEIVELLLKQGCNVNITDKTYNWTPLFYAARYGYQNIAKILLNYGCNVNAVNAGGNTCLHVASEYGHEKMVELLLSKGAFVDAADKMERTSLHFGSFEGHADIVRILLRWGASVNSKDINGTNPLYHAVFKGRKDIVEILMSNGAELVGARGEYLAHLSAELNHKDILEYLVQTGIPVDRTDGKGSTPLHAAVSKKGNVSVVKYLLSKGACVNSKNGAGATPLHIASFSGEKNIVGVLLDGGAEVNSDNRGIMPLHIATMANHIEVVDTLIANGAELNVRGEFGGTPLCIAVERNYKRIAKILISKGADVNLGQPLTNAICKSRNKILAMLLKVDNIVLDVRMDEKLKQFCLRKLADLTGKREAFDAMLPNGKDSRTFSGVFSKNSGANSLLSMENLNNFPLLPIAAFNGNTYAVEALLKKGIHPDFTGGVNMTALSLAANNGHEAVAEILLEYGADVNMESYFRLTALHFAAADGHKEVVEQLLSNGADVNVLDDHNQTPLNLAVLNGRREIVRTLLHQCSQIRIDAKYNDGWTLLHMAAQAGNLDIVKLLLEKGANSKCQNVKGSKPIHIAARQGHKSIVEFFIKNGLSISEKGAAGWTLLHYASIKGHIEVAEYLMKVGIDVDAEDLMGRTPLHMAADGGCVAMIVHLLKNGATYDLPNESGKRPVDLSTSQEVTNLFECLEKLFVAVKSEELSMVDTCIKNGALVDAKSVKHCTVLHYASWKGQENTVRSLLKYNANPNVVNRDGHAPLHYAAKFNHLGIVKALLSKGAVYNIHSNNSKTPSEITENREIQELLKLIDTSFKSVRNGETNFLEGLKNVTDVETAKALMNCRDKQGSSLIVAAIRNDFPRIMQLKEIFLEEAGSREYLAENMLQERMYKDAMDILQEILNERIELLGTDNPFTLEIRRKIAKALYLMNNYIGALHEMWEVHAKLESILGSGNKDSLSAKSAIALILYRLGKNEEAIDILEEVHPIQKEILGEGDSEVLRTGVHMALVLDPLGRYQEALELNNYLLEKYNAKYGSRDQRTMAVQNNLAMVLGKMERYAEAFEMCEVVHDKRKSILGPDHADTLRTFRNMAMVLIWQGRLEKGREMLEEVLERQTSVLGTGHFDTLSTQFQIGSVLFQQGMSVRALKMLTQGLDRRREILGKEHPEILHTLKMIDMLKIDMLAFKMISNDESNILNCLQDDIFVAASDGNADIVEGLIRNLNDPNSADKEGRTPMHFAVNGSHVNVVRVLLNNGGDVMKVTAKGDTVLHIATSKRDKEMVELLLRHGKLNILDKIQDFVNAKTKVSGSTALHVASKSGCWDIAKSLLEHGAIYNSLDNTGNRKPSDYSKDRKLCNLFRLIEELFSSAGSGDFGIIEELRKISPDELIPILNARNRDGKTAIQVAVANNQEDVARSLVKLLQECQVVQSGHKTLNSI